MPERRDTAMEKILHRIENRVEEWRGQDSARKTQADTDRASLWEEAKMREKLLAEAIEDEESQGGPSGEADMEHRAVFVVNSEETRNALEELANQQARLVGVVPGRGTSTGESSIKGYWLMFE